MSRFVLVHGAWHGAWCWDRVVPYLQAAGHTTMAVELAGHGTDRTPASAISLHTYVVQVLEALLTSAESAVLVGHSLGGVVITQAAELLPSRIRALVYVSAYLPRTGESLLEWAKRDSQSMVTRAAVRSRDRLTLAIRPRLVRQAFYADCAEEDATWATAQLVPEPALCFETPVTVTDANFGQVPRTYVHCTADAAVPYPLQLKMVEATHCTQVSLDAGHCPFISVPAELARVLERCTL